MGSHMQYDSISPISLFPSSPSVAIHTKEVRSQKGEAEDLLA